MKAQHLVISLLAALVMGVFFGALASPAQAHPTGNERRAVPGCMTLAPPLRAACRSCVTRPRPHHFHPNRAPGARCQPNDGNRGNRRRGRRR